MAVPANPAARTAEEVGKQLTLSDDAKAVPSKGLTAAAYARQLLDAGLAPDAIRLIAHTLPAPDAIRWAVACAKPSSPPGPAADALAAAERWLKQPTHANALQAQAAAEAAGSGTPAGCAALAAFFSGPSLAKADLPKVPPPPNLAAGVAAGAVLLGALAGEAEKSPERMQEFALAGLKMVAGPQKGP